MSTTIQDLVNELEDFSGNYDTGTVNDAIKIRHIDRAIAWVKREIGLPEDDRIQTIRFSQDQLYYTLNTDVDELLYLLWEEDAQNDVGLTWSQAPYDEILRHRGSGDRKYQFAQTFINGSKQIVIWGYNKLGGSTLDSMDNVGDWKAEGDASGLAKDDDVYYEGNASLSFDITNATGVASIVNDNVNIPIKDLIDKNGAIKIWNYMTDANIDDVTLYLYETDDKYYTINVTAQDDGTDFEADKWTKLGFYLENKTAVGSPDKNNNITKIKIEYDLGDGFTTASDFRVDQIFEVYPDDLELVYKSAIKGTDSTGATNKTTLNSATDIVAIGHDDLRSLIGMRACITLWPALKGDKDMYGAFIQELNSSKKSFARRSPRRRTAGTFKTYLRR